MQITIQTPTPKLNQSILFYEKLGFNIEETKNGAVAYGTNFVIEINKNRFSRPGIKITGENWSSFIASNKLNTAFSKTESGFLIVSPEGCCVYLEENNLLLNQNNFSEKVVLGEYAGLSLETNVIEKSIEFWSFFGFKQTAGNIDHGWISLTNETGMTISLMKFNCCPHLFFNPSLSFFNGKKNLEIISKIRVLEIEIAEEITHFNKENIVDNIIIRDPGGLGYFIFSD